MKVKKIKGFGEVGVFFLDETYDLFGPLGKRGAID